MRFASRQDAGHQLGQLLLRRGMAADMVLGLPRGGVVVAAEVARELKLPLDVLVVRKIGSPSQREFAVGALAEPDVLILDEMFLSEFPAARSQLNRVIVEETVRLRECCSRFHRLTAPALNDKKILLVDDGLATGATAEAAVLSIKRQKARRIIVAVPVASTSAFQRMERVAGEVVALVVDPFFAAVGQYYDDFSQTTDDQVVELLSKSLPPVK